jgi:predicted Rossmann fold flavoprotein
VSESISPIKIAIIGGGAAGFFAAINAASNFPKAHVVIFEKSDKVLAKVKVSGGGRCNVTNTSSSIKELIAAYPRGSKAMKKSLREFSTPDTAAWFAKRGVPLVAEADGRMFPRSNTSQSVIDCLLHECVRHQVEIRKQTPVEKIAVVKNGLELTIRGNEKVEHFNKVIVASGGSPKLSGLDWLQDLGHQINPPVPSLFTFNMPSERITELMGVAVARATVAIPGTKLKAAGPLLITHWGMSGPAILKLSAFGARELADRDYGFSAQVNWTNISNNDEVYKKLESLSAANPAKLLQNIRPFDLPQRLWLFLIAKCGLEAHKKWGELGKKGLNKLVNILTNDLYTVKGKTTFKEEFVTCGGVSLESISISTLESRVCPNLYFAGEVLDIDGITGGYNFQAAWTTAFIAARLG